MSELVLSARAELDIGSLPESLQNAVVRELDHLLVAPRARDNSLLGFLRGLRSALVGNYRVLYTIDGEPTLERIVVRAVRHRAVAYGRRLRR